MSGRFDFARSQSQRRTYRECGWKFLHKYDGHWTWKNEPGKFQFGHAMEHVAHGVACGWLLSPEEAQACFEALWLPLKNAPGYTWGERASWPTFYERGKVLSRMAAKELPLRVKPRLGEPDGLLLVNQRLTYRIEDWRELTVPDQLTYVQRKVGTVWHDDYLLTYLDVKTSQYEYDPLAAEMDEQLTDGQLGARMDLDLDVKQVGFLVFCWGYANPRIQFLLEPARGQAEVENFVAGALELDRQIRAGVFVRNDRACHAFGGCEYRPLCFRSQEARIDEELVMDSRREPEAIGLDDGNE